MKKILILILVFMSMACSKQMGVQDAQDVGFYFTDRHGALYEYTNEITKVETDGTRFIGISNTYDIYTSNKRAVNILSSNGHIVFRHEPKKQIAAATISKNGNFIYYATQDKKVYKYNKFSNSDRKYEVQLYPVPKQLILDEKQDRLIYHTGMGVHELNLKTLKKTQLLKGVYPIHSIAYHRISRTIYVSSAGYGKIYKLDKNTKTLELVHNPMSVSSTAICFNATDSQLYFSKSNGRDVTISALDMETGGIEDAHVLYSAFAINDLVIKE